MWLQAYLYEHFPPPKYMQLCQRTNFQIDMRSECHLSGYNKVLLSCMWDLNQLPGHMEPQPLLLKSTFSYYDVHLHDTDGYELQFLSCSRSLNT